VYDIQIRINLYALLSALQMLIHYTRMTVFFWTLLERRDIAGNRRAT